LKPDRGQPKGEKMATIPNHRISDLNSFESVTGDPRQVAGLYFYLKLDCLVDLAYKVSYDFFKRPHLYTALGAVQAAGGSQSLSSILAKLHARYGTNEFFPSAAQRNEIYLSVFGQASGYSAQEEGDFPRLRDGLIHAAAAFAERVFDTGAEMLRESGDCSRATGLSSPRTMK